MAIPKDGEYHSSARNSSVLSQSTSVDSGTEVVGQVYFPGGVSLFSGSGVPGKLVNGKQPAIGDLYIRLDGTVGSLIYRCTTGGAAPVWGVVL